MCYLAGTDRNPALVPLHSAACTYRIALGPRAIFSKAATTSCVQMDYL